MATPTFDSFKINLNYYMNGNFRRRIFADLSIDAKVFFKQLAIDYNVPS